MRLLNNIMIRLFAVFLSLGGVYTAGYAQNVSPSPNAAALESFSEIPVSLYTGIPSVNVPIYNLSSRHLSMPVSLSYHYSGLKPNQHASWVGLGWALNAGGVITRTMRGKPDELGSQGYFAVKDQIKHQYDHYYTDSSDMARLANAQEEWGFLKSIANGQKDGQPDVYSFNVAGYTGKFFIEKLGENNYKAYTIPYQNIKIDIPESFPLGEWTITVPNGTQYVFGGFGTDMAGNAVSLEEKSATSSTTNGGPPSSDTPYISAWYLKEVKSMNGDDKITFHYQVANPTGHYQSLYSERRQFLKSGQDLSACQNAAVPVSITATEVTATNRLHIAGIVTQTGHQVIFEEGAQRLDYSDNTLARILVKSRTGELIKAVDFTYDYLDNGNNFKRLLLTKVQELNGKQPIIAPSSLPTNDSELDYKGSYEFTYNTNITGAFAMDNSFVRSIDFWGFFNGAANTTLVPSYEYPANGIYFNGANRQVNPDAVKLGVLLSINNPTGGTTSLEWEANQYNATEDCDGKLEDKEKSLTVGANFRKDDPVNPDLKEKTFVLDCNQWVKLNVSIVDNYNGTAIPEVATGVSIFSVTKGGTQAQVFSANQTQTTSVYLKAGTYVVKAEAGAAAAQMPDNFSVLASIQCIYMNKSLVSSSGGCNKPGPGLRIAKITYADGLNQKNDIVKEYRYQLFDAPNTSSGKLMRPITSFNESKLWIKDPSGLVSVLCADMMCTYANLTSDSFSPGGYAKGSPICYTNVTVLEGKGGNNGRTDYTYSFQDDTKAAFAPREDLDWLRGHLKEKRVYDVYGRELTRSVNHYEGSFLDETQPQFHQVTGLAAKMTSSSPCNPDERTWSTKNVLDYATFNLTSAWHRLVRTENYSYFYDKGDLAGTSKKEMKTEKLYFYDNPTVHTFVTRTQTTDSEGRTVVTKSRYPQDVLFGEDFFTMAQYLVSRYHIGQPIVSYTMRDNEVLGASYQRYEIINNKLYPLQSYVAEFNQPLLEGQVFSKDANGDYIYFQKKVDIAYEYQTSNVIATTPNKDITSAVIWNSKNDLVIAKAVNTTPDKIAYSSFEEAQVSEMGGWKIISGATNWTTAQAHTGSQSILVGPSGFAAQTSNTTLPVGKYKVSFWIHSGGQAVSGLKVSKTGQFITPQKTLSRASQWDLYETVIELTTPGVISVEAPSGVYIDELRLRPVQARMATFNHRPLVGLVSQTGANHQTVYYEYDGLKRLRIVRDFDRNIIKRHTYKYKKVD